MLERAKVFFYLTQSALSMSCERWLVIGTKIVLYYTKSQASIRFATELVVSTSAIEAPNGPRQGRNQEVWMYPQKRCGLGVVNGVTCGGTQDST